VPKKKKKKNQQKQSLPSWSFHWGVEGSVSNRRERHPGHQIKNILQSPIKPCGTQAEALTTFHFLSPIFLPNQNQGLSNSRHLP
jgi:hypothetical protein